jgi:CRISPR type III-B/RAMP module RAMP protein Cmr1
MNTQTYTLEFISPCFCAGANQAVAELRAPAIRGQLHWWFRALGGTAAEEREAFGHVHGASPLVSSFIVRTTVLAGQEEKGWENKIPKQGVGNKTYLLGFFCGRTGRLRPSGALAPRSRASVTLAFRRPPTEKLQQAIRIFFSVGGLGFRSTRTGGAFFTEEHSLTQQGWDNLQNELENAGFVVRVLGEEFRNWVDVCERAGFLLRHKLRGRKEGLGISAGRNGNSVNALGSATPRQSSVVHLRPVMIAAKLRLALFEAPHTRILGVPARNQHKNRGSILKLANLGA